MNGVIRSPAIAPPLSRPTKAPVATMAATATAAGWPCWISWAPTTLASAMTEPTERSMPPLTMISVIPKAPMPTMTVWVRMILKLW